MTRHLARVVLLTFVLTFISARLLVYLIMARRMPDLFLHLGGTHVHHLNYGIFLLAGVGGLLLFGPAELSRRNAVAIAYGVGLALTFDEFGMWLHLGGGYWQRASFDAITVIAACLSLLAFSPWAYVQQVRTWWVALGLIVLVAAFFLMLSNSFRYVEHRFGPRLNELEQRGPQ